MGVHQWTGKPRLVPICHINECGWLCGCGSDHLLQQGALSASNGHFILNFTIWCDSLLQRLLKSISLSMGALQALCEDSTVRHFSRNPIPGLVDFGGVNKLHLSGLSFPDYIAEYMLGIGSNSYDQVSVRQERKQDSFVPVDLYCDFVCACYCLLQVSWLSPRSSPNFAL